MDKAIDPETTNLIEKMLLARFASHREEEVRTAIYAVADDLRAQGRDDITYETVRRVYMVVMMY